VDNISVPTTRDRRPVVLNENSKFLSFVVFFFFFTGILYQSFTLNSFNNVNITSIYKGGVHKGLILNYNIFYTDFNKNYFTNSSNPEI
jgi:hypothetical protein